MAKSLLSMLELFTLNACCLHSLRLTSYSNPQTTFESKVSIHRNSESGSLRGDMLFRIRISQYLVVIILRVYCFTVLILVILPGNYLPSLLSSCLPWSPTWRATRKESMRATVIIRGRKGIYRIMSDDF